MGVTRLIVIRHGAVAASWRGRVYGDLDVPLSAEGDVQARAAAELFADEALDSVISSGLARAERTAYWLRRGRGLERRDEPDLREISRGAWAGLLPEEIDARQDGAYARWLARPDAERPPGGESLTDLADRVLPRLQQLAAEFRGGCVAIASHAWVLRLVTCEALGIPLAFAPRLDPSTGASVIVDWPSDGPPEGEGWDASVRPVLAGFDADHAPPAATWYRAPRR